MATESISEFITSSKTFAKRFWSKVDIKGPDECWEWRRGLSTGYGSINISKTHRSKPSSRIAWILTYGEIFDGLWVLHKCDNRKCCNPNHLFLGTCLDNIQDMDSKGRRYKPQPKTHCVHGHAMTPENTMVSRLGRKRCRTCQRDTNKFASSKYYYNKRRTLKERGNAFTSM